MTFGCLRGLLCWRPKDSFRPSSLEWFLLCASHCINVSQSKRTVQGHEGCEELFIQRNHNEILWICSVVEARLASFDSAEVKTYALSVCA